MADKREELKISVDARFANPFPLLFSGAVEANYDGSKIVSVKIPKIDPGNYVTKQDLLNLDIGKVSSKDKKVIVFENAISQRCLNTNDLEITFDGNFYLYNIVVKPNTRPNIKINIPKDVTPKETARTIIVNILAKDAHNNGILTLNVDSSLKILNPSKEYKVEQGFTYTYIFYISDSTISIFSNDLVDLVMRKATRTYAGVVKIGEGLDITQEGLLSLDKEYVSDNIDHFNHDIILPQQANILFMDGNREVGRISADKYSGYIEKADSALRDGKNRVIHETYLLKSDANKFPTADDVDKALKKAVEDSVITDEKLKLFKEAEDIRNRDQFLLKSEADFQKIFDEYDKKLVKYDELRKVLEEYSKKNDTVKIDEEIESRIKAGVEKYSQSIIDNKISPIQSQITQFNDLIDYKISDKVSGAESRITQRVDGVVTQVNDNVNNLSTRFTQMSSGIDAKIENKTKGISTQITALESGIDAKIDNKTKGLYTRISAVEGAIGTEINDKTKGLTSRIVQLENAIQTKVESSAFESRFSQLDDTINLKVAEKTKGKADKDKLISQINLNPEGIRIDGRYVHVTGKTVFDDSIIVGKMLAANTIGADKMAVDSLSAISAKIGLLRTASSGARTEISNNLIEVYDNNGRLRVRMGVW